MSVIYRKLGKTELTVSALGFGSGGPRRLGLKSGGTVQEAETLVLAALDLGVTVVDTAPIYKTEEVVGQALSTRARDSYVLISKSPYQMAVRNGWRGIAERAVRSLDASLKRLRTDYLDLYVFHSIAPGTHDRVVDEVYEAILREREKGKFRFIGISEATADADHQMLWRTNMRLWDAVMLRYGPANKSRRVLAHLNSVGTGTIAVFVNHQGIPSDKAYLFAAGATDCAMMGTENLEHLRANIATFSCIVTQ